MTQAEERRSVVAEARKWLLTPYRHAADIRGVGVDCGMFIVRVFVDLGLTPPFDPRPYALDWMIHRNEEKYLEFFNRRCRRVQEPQPGDIVLFHYGRSYSHGGIVTEADPLTIIHAYHDADCVVEERLSQNPALTDPRRKRAYFSIWART
jgi:NlpC/P60 family putative phage cell wall peptidase